jgi:predicted nucleotidyltransferase
MSNSLLDLSGKIDSALVEVLDAVAEVASAKGIPYFVVGATARDVVLSHGYGIESKRATVDIDLGVEVAEWEEFSALKGELIATGRFEPTKATQRLIYRHALPIDIVPFGPLEHANKEITWPPDHSVRMNVLGFEDAFRSAKLVRLRSDPVLDVPFATPAGLAVLKVISWSERTPQGDKDAGDLLFLMRNYLDAGNQERMAEEHPDLLAVDGFDYELSGARLLGRDMTKIMSPETRRVVLETLERETGDQERYRLVEKMMRHYAGVGDAFKECLLRLAALNTGAQEG